jgi:hypothetical protein
VTSGSANGQQAGNSAGGSAWPGPWLLPVALVALVALCLVWATSCSSGGGSTDGQTTSSTGNGGSESGDIEGSLGADIKVGAATVTVRALQATFQPAMPEQRLSEETPSAPAANESFYQAYVRVKNTGVTPLRVDPEDFACAIGDSVVAIEPTRSGPSSRSLLKNTSLDLLLTFEGPAGFPPVLLYRPPWYDGVISVSPQVEETTTTAA